MVAVMSSTETSFQVHRKAGQCYICGKGGQKNGIYCDYTPQRWCTENLRRTFIANLGAEQPQWDGHWTVNEEIFCSGYFFQIPHS